jgi:hypothetical protein
MGTTIIFRRGENDPTSGSGLTLAEPAFNTTLKTFHIGLGHGITAAWVGAPISGLSADIAAGITYKIPTLAAVKNYIGGLCYGNTGAATITQYVSSFNGLTGAVQGVSSVNGFTGAITVSGGTGISLNSSSNSITVNTTVLPTNTFAIDRKHLLMAGTTNGNSSLLADNNLVYKPNLRTLGAKNSLSISGLDANYGEVNTIQLSGNTASGINVYTATNTVTLKVAADGDFTNLTFETGNEENLIETLTGTITFADYLTDIRTYYLPDASGTVALTSQLMGAVNGSTAATTAVTSFNGLTGSVGGVCAAQTNTFTALQSFASGISASGITVGGSMTVTGNLTVSGGVTFTISENVLIEDNIIILNSNVTGSPSENAGIEIERGTSANVQLLWNESSDKWTFTNDGSTYYDLPTSVVTSFNGLTGAVQGVSAAVAGTGISVSGATGAVTITNIGVQSFNGNTGAVTGASLGANTFTGLNSFNAGISSFGGTFSGNIVQFLSGLSAGLVRIGSLESNGSNPVTLSDYRLRFTVLGFPSYYTTLQADPTTSADRTVTLADASGTVALTSQLMGAVNGSTAATSAVTSFNGLTGAVTGVTVGGANTFTALNSFNAGISASGATFSGDIAVNGGDITTTATTATLYNTNATTVTIGSSAGSVTVSSGNTSGMTFGMGFYHKFKTKRVETVTTSQTEIFRFNYKNASVSVVGGLDAAYAEIIITAEQTPGFGACFGTQITKLLIASNPADGTVFHTEYGNVNTNGNLASYTASISGNDVIVYATPTSSDNTVFKVLATLIRGEYGEGI